MVSFLRCVFAATLLLVADAAHPKSAIRQFIVNLDSAPEERYNKLMEDPKIKTAFVSLVDIIKPIFNVHPTTHKLAAAVNESIATDLRLEMMGIAAKVDIPYYDVLLANLFYEITGIVNTPLDLSRSCTSIAVQRSNGTVFLGRNQDYPPPFTLVMVHYIFMRKGKVLYQGTSYAGTIGLSTAASAAQGGEKGGWAVSINARGNPAQGTPAGEQAGIAAALRGAAIFPIFTRQAMEAAGSDYKAAVNFLTNTELIMPGYVIVAGSSPGEGAIITRNATSNTTDVFPLFNKEHDAAGGGWYVAQTNTDHWEKAPDYPGFNTSRRATATGTLDAITAEDIDLQGLWQVLDTEPVFNAATIHTDLVAPEWGEYQTWKREGPL